jgi:hypothetical protein
MEFPFFKKVFRKLGQYISLLDDIIVDTLTDFKSLRYQLVIWAYILNFSVLGLVYLGKADYKLAGVSIALLTAVYHFFFKSKEKQALLENAVSETDAEPPVDDRDPDKL